MATTAPSAASSSSLFSIDSSMSRSRRGDSSSWMPDAIHDDPPRSVSPPAGKDAPAYDNADKKPAWNKPSVSSAEVRPVMPADSWPALSLSARPSSSLEFPRSLSGGSSSSMPPPQARGTPLKSTSHANTVSVAVNGQRIPFRRNNNTSSSSSTISNPSSNASPATPRNTRDQIHSQRGGSYGSGTTHFRNSHRDRNNSSYPRGDGLHHGNRRNYEHGNRSGFSHRNYDAREVHLQPQRGIGMMRPQMMMGPPSFPSHGGPMFYPDYAPHVFMPHPPPESMALVGQFPPLPMYFPSFDAVLYNKILAQVEYYFSADNMSRDKYLRTQMNDEGWVPVRVVAEFRRLAELTNNIQTILEALRSSEVVEIKGETLRRRGDWHKYLLPREPSMSGPAVAASNSGSLGTQLESMTLSERSREGA